MKWMSFISLTGIALLITSCSMLQRHPDSGYSYDRSFESNYAQQVVAERERHNRERAREDLGLSSTRVLGERERMSVEYRLHLQKLESQIQTRREKRQYYGYKSSMSSDRERIYFLKLPSFEARERYASQRAFNSTDAEYSDNVVAVIEANDIIKGMSKKAVTESWGDPDAVEVAGDPVYGVERWRYQKYISSNEGFRKELRIIYFEGGRVTGWETL